VKLRKFNYPVIFDATHSVQLPSSKNGSSGGEAEYVPYLARAAAAVGCDGIFMEVHPNPALASSDKYSQIDLSTFSSILKDLSSILSVLK
jgi:2-dehydro-3-deoxyphosphooctonate aldolase (KDO 8-P synthase)